MAVLFGLGGRFDLGHFHRFLLFAIYLSWVLSGDRRDIFVQDILVLRNFLEDNFINFSARVTFLDHCLFDLLMKSEQIFILKCGDLWRRSPFNEILHALWNLLLIS